jgi:transposase
MIKYALGIDISMNSFHACLSGIDSLQTVKVKSTSSFSNTLPGFKLLHQWIQKHYQNADIPLITVMEATGVYYEQCAMFLFKAGYNVAIVLPNKAKKYLQSIGLKSKNDKIDSKGLSRMAAEQALPLWQPMDDFFYQLRSLTRQHQSLQELKTSVGNQLHSQLHSAFPSKFVVKQLKQSIANIDRQLDAIKVAINSHLKSNSVVANKVNNISKIKGVGVLTVAVIIAETNGFTLFENIKQLVSYAGYDIVENQSGKHTGKTKISKKGNGHIRRALHMPAFNLIRYKVPAFLNLFERTFERHKIKMKSYVAIQKKLLILVYTLWNNDMEFVSNYQEVITGKMEPVISSQFSFEEAGEIKSSADQRTALHKVINRQNIAV